MGTTHNWRQVFGDVRPPDDVGRPCGAQAFVGILLFPLTGPYMGRRGSGVGAIGRLRVVGAGISLISVLGAAEPLGASMASRRLA